MGSVDNLNIRRSHPIPARQLNSKKNTTRYLEQVCGPVNLAVLLARDLHVPLSTLAGCCGSPAEWNGTPGRSPALWPSWRGTRTARSPQPRDPGQQHPPYELETSRTHADLAFGAAASWFPSHFQDSIPTILIVSAGICQPRVSCAWSLQIHSPRIALHQKRAISTHNRHRSGPRPRFCLSPSRPLFAHPGVHQEHPFSLFAILPSLPPINKRA